MNLTDWGFSGPFPALAAEYPDALPGRVVSQEKGMYRVVCAWGALSAELSGRYRYTASAPADFPVTGDFVMLTSAGGDHAVIHRLLPRKSLFSRSAAGPSRAEQLVAANIDTVFLCMALERDFNLRRLERYLSIAWDSGAVPVVVLTKADLCGEPEEKAAAARNAAPGAEVVTVSSLEEYGAAALSPWLLPGRTVALLGSSGVGKSTLINCLLGQERLLTGVVQEDGKGRHTTTRRQLLQLPCGALVIDTPGMRELGLFDSGEGVDRAFPEIEALLTRCRFADCTHTAEPGCAVLAALEQGSVSPERWAAYQKLQAENALSADASAFFAAKREKMKAIAKYNKQNQKRW